MKLKFLRRVVAQLGMMSAMRYFLCFGLAKLGVQPDYFTLTSRKARHPLVCRKGTSDLSVFNQVFIFGEYDCIDNLSDVITVIDCGANVGYSAAYFLSRFSQCKVIAIEPDAGNYEILKQNLENYRDRAKTIKAAVWSDAVRLKLVDSSYRGGSEWALHVQEYSDSEGQEIGGIDLPGLLSAYEIERVDLLKIDVEGAEVPIFASPNLDQWLNKVDLIAIELHSDSVFGDGVQSFTIAMRDKPFSICSYGEITIARRENRESTK